VSVQEGTQKPPELRPPGVFYSVVGGWLIPKAGYRLLLPIQPFADEVANNTRHNRKKK